MRSRLNALFDALLPVLATLAALGVGAIMLIFLKVNPVTAYKALWDGAFGSSNAFAETLVKATPLLLVALGICISFRGDVINIGGEGQMIIGAVLATWVGLTFTGLPGWLAVIICPSVNSFKFLPCENTPPGTQNLLISFIARRWTLVFQTFLQLFKLKSLPHSKTA